MYVVIGIVAGLLIGALLLVLLFFLAPRRYCPGCGLDLPVLRKPRSLRHALFGGWLCPRCGTEVDRRGHAIRWPQRPVR